MSGDPELRALARSERRARALPHGTRCAVCGVAERLSARRAEVRCYTHLNDAAGATEVDHPASRAAMPRFTVALDANAHRRVTELRQAIGFDEWPSGSDPLLIAARFLAGAASILWLVAEWCLDAWRAQAEARPLPPFPVAQ